MKEHFERFEIYFNNWWGKNIVNISLLPELTIGMDKQHSKAFSVDEEYYPSYIGYTISIGWLCFGIYLQLNFKTNKNGKR